MKKRDFERQCKRLLPHLPAFTYSGWMLYAEPVEHVLRGFFCEDSEFDAHRFSLTVFFLPLYVPTTHVHLNFGQRLKDVRGCDIWWSLNEPRVSDELLLTIRQVGLPFLEAVKQPRQLEMAMKRLGASSDPYKMEAVAYSLAMADDVTAAQQALQRLTSILDRNIPWQSTMLDRAELLSQQLASAPWKAKQQLKEWENDTVRYLGI